MSTELDDRSAREARLDQILGDYLAAGPDPHGTRRAAILRLYPDLAADLAAYFDDADRLHALAPPWVTGDVSTAADPDGPTRTFVSIEATEPDPAEPTRTARPDLLGETVDQPPRGPGDGGGGGPDEPDDPDDLPAGELVRYFGDYQLRQVLGRGGMGIVYLADQLSLKRLVALKMIRSGYWADDDEIQRFQNEAQAVAQLDHPGIVTIHEVGEHRGQHYFSMPLVAGGGLDKQLGRFRDDPRAAARLVSKVARAIHYMHQRAILHRDLKPSNILLDEEGDPHVTDFGLARRMDGDHDLSRSGAIVGTAPYMSPEQAIGSRRSLTTATDVHGLGTILYALLTGHAPFTGTSLPEILMRVRDHMPVRPSVENPHVDRDVETICLRCLEKDPRRRFDSAAALANELDRYLDGKPILSRPVSAWERGVKWARRRPLAAALVGVSGLAAFTLVGLAVALSYQGKLRAAHAAVSRSLENERRFLYENRVIFADRVLHENNTRRAEALLDECPPDRREWEWHYLKRQCHPELWTGPTPDGAIYSVAFRPDGRLIASVGATGHSIRLWDAENGTEIRSFPTSSAHPFSVAFSPDGTRLALLEGRRGNAAGQVSVREVETGRVVFTHSLDEVWQFASVAFSPDGRALLTCSGGGLKDGWFHILDAESGEERLHRTTPGKLVSGTGFIEGGRAVAAAVGRLNTADPKAEPGEVWIWDTQSGERRARLSGHTDPLLGLATSPDGTRIASCGYDATVRVWDVAQGQAITVYRGHDQCVNQVVFSPDGRRIASTSDDGSAHIWEAETGQPLVLLRGHQGPFLAVAFSPDGRRLVTGGEDGAIKVWDAEADKSATTLVGHALVARGVCFRPDGVLLASCGLDATVKLWDVRSGLLVRSLTGHRDPVYGLAFSPDGRLLATAGGDWQHPERPGEVILWDVASGRPIHTLSAHKGIAWCVAFSPDGLRLASGGGEAYSPDQDVIVWDVATGRQRQRFPGMAAGVIRVAFTPDGRRLAAVFGRDVESWDAESGENRISYVGHEGPVKGLAFSPDGRHIVTCGYDQTARLWDAASGREVRALRGHAGWINGLAISSDGRRIVTGSHDQILKIWDPNLDRELLSLKGQSGMVFDVAFSPDGRLIAAAYQNGQIKIWDGSPTPGGEP